MPYIKKEVTSESGLDINLGVGDGLAIIEEFQPSKTIAVINTVLTFTEAFNNLAEQNYPQFGFNVVEIVGGTEVIVFKAAAGLYKSDMMQTEIGKVFYSQYIYNAKMYYETRDSKYLERSSRDYRLMWDAYNNMQKK